MAESADVSLAADGVVSVTTWRNATGAFQIGFAVATVVVCFLAVVVDIAVRCLSFWPAVVVIVLAGCFFVWTIGSTTCRTGTSYTTTAAPSGSTAN